MAILRSLRQLARKTSYTRPFFISTPNPTSLRTLRSSIFLSRSSNLLSPSIPNFHGPLFLSYPPWKLLQLATPLYFQSDVVSVPKLRPLDFLPEPINLGTSLDHNKDSEIFGSRGGDGLVRSFVNWPNFISMSRLVSGPVLGWMIMQDMYLPAFIGLVVSGATDWLDGYVARKMGINSVVGSYLDPLADKVLIGCVAMAMVERGLLHSGLVALVVIRDLALVGGAVYIRANHLGSKSRSWSEFFNLDGVRPQKVEPLMISKVNTCFQLALVTGALLQPEFGTQETESYITYLSWLVAATTVGSTVAYGTRHLKSGSIFIRKNS
ncbi:putative CDP-alcohol phosphatidyltransferase [Helianthus annuus]|uniref:CDP-alcohol phosphatidyltransferase n=1 Tax=Helianthus annuus TaxID=4232 RepID=A0A251VM53_HELAN|nr:cardiolipin synthase (CMP-forming), mitochondrial [Helianthus annuus]KAF5820846.1 putative CDP-alcohol phosphatidyltransferase [Helianthus annuus]KAJ0610596.1 putative CDP-alcohol phosphatidyltransferase, CDP-alcohol phosphotransferase, transmembrane [Helianthus annuus]KAJ0621344.1 putative CDP-alcohol phosphatidyltransferase, CDP-alcohol phosphotransferase, transmembrane [Helianthus annuus]KAJ0625847.1 putative CDP-alcohol phosphatidyltransferase, CDP-alcohol phosphotransferase, transmembra